MFFLDCLPELWEIGVVQTPNLQVAAPPLKRRVLHLLGFDFSAGWLTTDPTNHRAIP
jgi:hypothetical protein